MREYQLTLNEQQVEIAHRALEFYERVGGLGQIEEVMDPWRLRCEANVLEPAECALREVKRYLTGFGYGASYGIRSEEVPDEYRVAYDLQQVLRHRLAWDRTPGGGIGVWFDRPHQTGQVPLAKIEHAPDARSINNYAYDIVAVRDAVLASLKRISNGSAEVTRQQLAVLLRVMAGELATEEGPNVRHGSYTGTPTFCGNQTSRRVLDASVSLDSADDLTCPECREIFKREADEIKSDRMQKNPELP